ncbi:MAG: HflX GTPase family protein [Candidatus Hodarchaeales archaeon]
MINNPNKKPCFTALMFIPGETDLEDEFLNLVDTAGYFSVKHYIQKGYPKAATLFGMGKIDELGMDILEWFKENRDSKLEKIIFGNKLKPSQVVNIEQRINTEYLAELGKEIIVMDKFQLVLEIFEENAKTEEARLQVQLASKKYLLPFQRQRLIAKMGSTRKGDAGTGTFAGTGTSLRDIQETDYKRSRAVISKKLQSIEKHRISRRSKYKKRTDFITVSLLGYTSAGKSSLLNALTKAGVEVAETLFTTLSTKTSSVKLDDIVLLVSDTVGFIEDLPPFLFNAFKSTLEEATDTDIIMCIVDASEDDATMLRKMTTTFKILDELNIKDNHHTGIVLTKNDLVENINEKLAVIKSLYPDLPIVSISAVKGDLDGFYELVSRFFPRFLETISFSVANEKLKYDVYNELNVLSERYIPDQESIELNVATRRPEWFETWINKLKKNTDILVSSKL